MKDSSNIVEEFSKFSKNKSLDSNIKYDTKLTIRELNKIYISYLSNFKYNSLLLLTISEVYNDISSILDKEDFEVVYNFLVNYSSRVTSKLIDGKKLSNSILTKEITSNIDKELERYSSEEFIKLSIPTYLSYIHSTKFDRKYKESLESLDKDSQDKLVTDLLDKINSNYESANEYLLSIKNTYMLLENCYLNNITDNFTLDTNIDNSNDTYIFDRILRVFLLIESYRRLVTDNDYDNSKLLHSLMDILELHII